MQRSNPAGRPARPRGRPARAGLREHLLLHTLRVLLRDGYEQFSMKAVADSASASKETLYRHFRDKAGLLGASLDYLGRTVEPLLLEGVRDGLGRRECLELLAGNYLRGCVRAESLALQRLAYADAGRHLGPVFAKQFTEASLAVIAREFIRMKTPKPKLDAEVFLAMAQGQVHEKALLGVVPGTGEKAIKAVTVHAVGIFLAYLGKRGT